MVVVDSKKRRSKRSSSSSTKKMWICPICTLENNARKRRCGACESRRPIGDDETSGKSLSYDQEVQLTAAPAQDGKSSSPLLPTTTAAETAMVDMTNLESGEKRNSTGGGSNHENQTAAIMDMVLLHDETFKEEEEDRAPSRPSKKRRCGAPTSSSSCPAVEKTTTCVDDDESHNNNCATAAAGVHHQHTGDSSVDKGFKASREVESSSSSAAAANSDEALLQHADDDDEDCNNEPSGGATTDTRGSFETTAAEESTNSSSSSSRKPSDTPLISAWLQKRKERKKEMRKRKREQAAATAEQQSQEEATDIARPVIQSRRSSCLLPAAPVTQSTRAAVAGRPLVRVRLRVVDGNDLLTRVRIRVNGRLVAPKAGSKHSRRRLYARLPLEASLVVNTTTHSSKTAHVAHPDSQTDPPCQRQGTYAKDLQNDGNDDESQVCLMVAQRRAFNPNGDQLESNTSPDRQYRADAAEERIAAVPENQLDTAPAKADSTRGPAEPAVSVEQPTDSIVDTRVTQQVANAGTENGECAAENDTGCAERASYYSTARDPMTSETTLPADSTTHDDDDRPKSEEALSTVFSIREEGTAASPEIARTNEAAPPACRVLSVPNDDDPAGRPSQTADGVATSASQLDVMLPAKAFVDERNPSSAESYPVNGNHYGTVEEGSSTVNRGRKGAQLATTSQSGRPQQPMPVSEEGEIVLPREAIQQVSAPNAPTAPKSSRPNGARILDDDQQRPLCNTAAPPAMACERGPGSEEVGPVNHVAAAGDEQASNEPLPRVSMLKTSPQIPPETMSSRTPTPLHTQPPDPTTLLQSNKQDLVPTRRPPSAPSPCVFFYTQATQHEFQASQEDDSYDHACSVYRSGVSDDGGNTLSTGPAPSETAPPKTSVAPLAELTNSPKRKRFLRQDWCKIGGSPGKKTAAHRQHPNEPKFQKPDAAQAHNAADGNSTQPSAMAAFDCNNKLNTADSMLSSSPSQKLLQGPGAPEAAAVSESIRNEPTPQQQHIRSSATLFKSAGTGAKLEVSRDSLTRASDLLAKQQADETATVATVPNQHQQLTESTLTSSTCFDEAKSVQGTNQDSGESVSSTTGLPAMQKADEIATVTNVRSQQHLPAASKVGSRSGTGQSLFSRSSSAVLSVSTSSWARTGSILNQQDPQQEQGGRRAVALFQSAGTGAKLQVSEGNLAKATGLLDGQHADDKAKNLATISTEHRRPVSHGETGRRNWCSARTANLPACQSTPSDCVFVSSEQGPAKVGSSTLEEHHAPGVCGVQRTSPSASATKKGKDFCRHREHVVELSQADAQLKPGDRTGASATIMFQSAGSQKGISVSSTQLARVELLFRTCDAYSKSSSNKAASESLGPGPTRRAGSTPRVAPFGGEERLLDGALVGNSSSNTSSLASSTRLGHSRSCTYEKANGVAPGYTTRAFALFAAAGSGTASEQSRARAAELVSSKHSGDEAKPRAGPNSSLLCSRQGSFHSSAKEPERNSLRLSKPSKQFIIPRAAPAGSGIATFALAGSGDQVKPSEESIERASSLLATRDNVEKCPARNCSVDAAKPVSCLSTTAAAPSATVDAKNASSHDSTAGSPARKPRKRARVSLSLSEMKRLRDARADENISFPTDTSCQPRTFHLSSSRIEDRDPVKALDAMRDYGCVAISPIHPEGHRRRQVNPDDNVTLHVPESVAGAGTACVSGSSSAEAKMTAALRVARTEIGTHAAGSRASNNIPSAAAVTTQFTHALFKSAGSCNTVAISVSNLARANQILFGKEASSTTTASQSPTTPSNDFETTAPAPTGCSVAGSGNGVEVTTDSLEAAGALLRRDSGIVDGQASERRQEGFEEASQPPCSLLAEPGRGSRRLEVVDQAHAAEPATVPSPSSPKFDAAAPVEREGEKDDVESQLDDISDGSFQVRSETSANSIDEFDPSSPVSAADDHCIGWTDERFANATFRDANRLGIMTTSMDQMASHGVVEATLKVSSNNAVNLRFDCSSGAPVAISRDALDNLKSDSEKAASAGVGADSPSADSHSSRRVGALADYRQALEQSGLDVSTCGDKWIHNHVRWIIWKLASTERRFSYWLGGWYLTFDRVAAELEKRFHIEVSEGRRPGIRKLLNRDIAANQMMVLCVAHIRWSSDCRAPSQKCIFELTDGWYSLRSAPDSVLTKLAETGKISVGSKLLISNAFLVGGDDGVDPLDETFSVTSSPVLKIFANSTRLARWNARLGFVRPSSELKAREGLLLVNRVSDIVEGGGHVPLIDLVVERKNPIMFLQKERAGDGQHERKAVLTESEEAERIRSIDKKRQLLAEKFSEEVAEEVTEEVDGDAPDVWHKFVGHVSPDDFYERLEGDDRLLIDRWQERRAWLIRKRVDDEVSAKLEGEDCDLSPSTPFVRIAVRTRSFGDDDSIGKTEQAFLTIWDPTEEQIETFKEGAMVRCKKLSVRDARYDGCLQLTGNGRTGVALLANTSLRCSSGQSFSTVLGLHKRLKERCVPPEVLDVVGVVVQASQSSSPRAWSVYLTDQSGLLLCVAGNGRVPDICSSLALSTNAEDGLAADASTCILGFRELNLCFNQSDKCAFADFVETSVIAAPDEQLERRLRAWSESKRGRSRLRTVADLVDSQPRRCGAPTSNVTVAVGYVVGLQVASCQRLFIQVDCGGDAVMTWSFPLRLVASFVALENEADDVALSEKEEHHVGMLSALQRVLRSRKSPYLFELRQLEELNGECSLEVVHVGTTDTEALTSVFAQAL